MNPYKETLRKFFSEYFGALRKRRGLTQEQMAEKLRITGRAYSDLERGIWTAGVQTRIEEAPRSTKDCALLPI